MAVGLGVVAAGGGALVANGVGAGVNPCYVLEDYVWVDREGMPTSPPHNEPARARGIIKKVGSSIPSITYG